MLERLERVEKEQKASSSRKTLSSSSKDVAIAAQCPLRKAVINARDEGVGADTWKKGLLRVMSHATRHALAGLLACHANIFDNMLIYVNETHQQGLTLTQSEGDDDTIVELLQDEACCQGDGLLASQSLLRSHVRTSMTRSTRNKPFFPQHHTIEGRPQEVVACADKERKDLSEGSAGLESGPRTDPPLILELVDIELYKPVCGREYITRELKCFVSWEGESGKLSSSQVERVWAANFKNFRTYMTPDGPWTVHIPRLLQQSRAVAVKESHEDLLPEEEAIKNLWLACARAWNSGLKSKHASLQASRISCTEVKMGPGFHRLRTEQLRDLLPIIAGAWILLRVEQWTAPRLAWVVNHMQCEDELASGGEDSASPIDQTPEESSDEGSLDELTNIAPTPSSGRAQAIIGGTRRPREGEGEEEAEDREGVRSRRKRR